jgi:nucleotidyltransferase/DNA polymerase involved in DNA repair
MPASPSRSEKLDLRVKPAAKRMLQEATRERHTTVTQFVLDSTIAAAPEVLAERTRTADTTCAIAAKAFGVKTGTRIWEAKQRCPGLILVPARHEAYVLLHEQAKEAIETCHPITAICSIDEIARRLGGRDRVPRAARALAMETRGHHLA